MGRGPHLLHFALSLWVGACRTWALGTSLFVTDRLGPSEHQRSPMNRKHKQEHTSPLLSQKRLSVKLEVS